MCYFFSTGGLFIHLFMYLFFWFRKQNVQFMNRHDWSQESAPRAKWGWRNRAKKHHTYFPKVQRARCGLSPWPLNPPSELSHYGIPTRPISQNIAQSFSSLSQLNLVIFGEHVNCPLFCFVFFLPFDMEHRMLFCFYSSVYDFSVIFTQKMQYNIFQHDLLKHV